MNWLLAFVPIAIGLEYLAPERHLLVFATSCLAMLPLAGWMGHATEQLAERMGEGVGGLLNATFGNAAELIIALAALGAGCTWLDIQAILPPPSCPRRGVTEGLRSFVVPPKSSARRAQPA
jgi:calcium/proton exchanger cax